jgi:mRNA-degrading endonuclease RelE of RelBE toxin-antitoxin system
MIVRFNEKFDKDLSNLDKSLITRIFSKINLLKNSNNLSDIYWIRKLSWYENYYRLRIWDYRLWFSYNNWVIV